MNLIHHKVMSVRIETTRVVREVSSGSLDNQLISAGIIPLRFNMKVESPQLVSQPVLSLADIANRAFLKDKKLMAFDVDGTLVDGKRTAETMPLLKVMVEHLKILTVQGGKLALISGSPEFDLGKKILYKEKDMDGIIDLIKKEDPALLDHFEMYASGGVVRMTFDRDGKAIYDSTFASHIQIPAENIEKTRSVVQVALRNPTFWGETPAEQEAALAKFSAWSESQGEGKFPGLNELNNLQIKAVEVGVKDEASAVRVEIRRDPNNERIVRLTIKVTPKSLDNIDTGYLDRLTKLIEAEFGIKFQVQPAGFASINLNLAGQGGKGLAVQNLIDILGIKPEQVLYFGDELGKTGNDREAFDVAGIVGVNIGGSPVEDKGSHMMVDAGPELSAKGPSATRAVLEQLLPFMPR